MIIDLHKPPGVRVVIHYFVEEVSGIVSLRNHLINVTGFSQPWLHTLSLKTIRIIQLMSLGLFCRKLLLLNRISFSLNIFGCSGKFKRRKSRF